MPPSPNTIIGVPRPIEERLFELKRKLVQRNLRFPALHGSATDVDTALVGRLLGSSKRLFDAVGGAQSARRRLLNNMVAEIGLMSAHDFDRLLDGDPDFAIATHAPDPIWLLLSAWADKLRRAGLKVPCYEGDRSKPAWTLIAADAQLDRSALKPRRPRYRQFIDALIAELGVLTPREFQFGLLDPSGRPAAAKASHRADKLRRHIRVEHLEKSKSLPESSKGGGLPGYRRIIANAGLTYEGAKAEDELIAIVDAAADVVGIGSDCYRPIRPGLTYRRLLMLGEERAQLEDSRIAEQTLARFLSALRSWMRVLGRAETDVAFPDFCDAYAERVARVADTFPNPDTRKRWLSNMGRWREIIVSLERSLGDDLPSDFAGALRLLHRRANSVSISAVIREAELERHATKIHSWASGRLEPTEGEEPIVRRLEAHFEVEPGTLTGRIRKFLGVSPRSFRSEVWPPSLRAEVPGDAKSEAQVKKLRSYARRLLPKDFQYLSLDEKERIGRSIKAEFETKIKYRQARRNAEPWRVRELPPQIRATWERLVAYKTDPAPEFDRARSWSERGTVSRVWNILHELFSWFALPQSSGGLGIPVSDISFGLLACPEVFRRYVLWQRAKGGGTLNTGSRTWTGVLAHLTAPDTKDKRRRSTGIPGFLHFLPELASELTPIAGLLSEADIAHLRTRDGWAAGLSSFNQVAWKMWAGQEDNLQHSRDPFEPIRPILQLAEPMRVIYDMVAQAARDLPDPKVVNPRTRAIAVRRFVTLVLIVETALRRWNIAELVWLAENKGQFQRTKDGWQINLAVAEFKNSDSSFFGVHGYLGRTGSAYINLLPQEYTSIFDEYISTSRPLLLDGRTSDALLINKKGTGLNHNSITRDFTKFTWIYLVWHESTGTGLPGVEKFGPHAIRHIIATDILKNTGDARLAADAIQDTVETVLSMYAFVLTEQKVQRVNAFRETRKQGLVAALAA